MSTATEPSAGTLVIGIGNEYRGDDAAGLFAARRIREAGLGITVIESDGDGAALMEAWSRASSVILIDAARSGAPPGTIRRLNVQERPLPRGAFTSTHAFGLAEAVELSRALGTLPPRMVIYAIECATVAAGASFSPEVERAIPKLVEMVLDHFPPLSQST